jgi:ADP-ribose pyrophosphatase YjhB (NUDIX family)
MPNVATSSTKTPRVAVRAVLVETGRLLLVNAWPGGRSDLLCAPGGGVQPGTSLPDNLKREVFEETGLTIAVGAPCLVNEFHDPRSGFHQVEIFFRCRVEGDAEIAPDWRDPEAVVSEHHWLTEEAMRQRRVKPAALIEIAFSLETPVSYDPLEPIVF